MDKTPGNGAGASILKAGLARAKERWLGLFSRRRSVWLAAIGLFCLASILGWTVSTEGNGSLSALVTASAPVTRGDVERTLHATGIIKPEEGAQVKTGSRFTGVIEKLHVKLGDAVTSWATR